jgi:hypothetical protein
VDLVTGQSIYYSNKNHLPLEDVAESLLALKSIIEVTPFVLERLSPGLSIQRTHVFVNEVKAGSLWEDLIVKFVWGNQEKLNQDITELRSELKVDSLLNNRLLIGTIIGALVTGGGLYLLKKFSGSEEQKQILQANQNIFIVSGAAQAGVSEDQFKSILDTAILKNPQVAKDAVRVVRPAKREGDVSIVFNRDSSSEIGNRAIKAMPSNAPEEEQLETVEDYENVEIQIRAIDLDSTKRGWAAVVPSVASRRTKMHLDPHIKLTDLLGKTAIKGDVTVVFRSDDVGTRVPVLIFLRDISK